MSVGDIIVTVLLIVCSIPILNILLNVLTNGGLIKFPRTKQYDKDPIYRLLHDEWFISYTIAKYELCYKGLNADTKLWVIFIPFSGLFKYYGYHHTEENFGEYYKDEVLKLQPPLEELYEAAYREKYEEKLKKDMKANRLQNHINILNEEFNKNHR